MLNPVTRRKVFERYLTEKEELLLFKHIARFSGDVLAQRDHAWMTFLRHTGLRVGTLAQLTVADARAMLASDTVHVDDSIAKGHRGYETPLKKAAAAALRKLLSIRREQGFENAAGEPLIMSQRRRALSVRSLQARMKFWVRDAKLPVDASPHWLRHTLAKRIMANSEARDPGAIVQIALGHRHRETTAIYTLPDRAEVRAALEAA